MSWVAEIGPLSIRNMRYFVAFVEAGSIRGAAARAGSSAAVLRSRMKSLSEALGQPLFDRGQSGVTLTPAGADLFVACKETLAQLDKVKTEIKSAQTDGVIAGQVRFGIDPGVARVLMTSVILPLLSDHPQLDIIAYEASGPTLASWLETGMIDLAIGLPSIRHWWITELAEYRDRLVLCSRDPLPEDVVVSMPAGGDEPATSMFACYPLPSRERARLDWSNPPLQVNGFLTSMVFVGKGDWCAIVPLSAVLGEVEAGSLHICAIDSLPVERRVIARHTDKPLNSAAELVVAAVSGALPGLDHRVTAQCDRSSPEPSASTASAG